MRRSLTVDGRRRTYLVVAADDRRAGAPILLAFHGYSKSGASLAETSGLGPAAARRGFVTVFPDGTGTPARWGLPGRLRGADDVRFVDALVPDVARRSCGDAGRVYAAGFSNGAAFTGLLACARPHLLRGVAMVGGANLAAPCAAPRLPVEVPVVIVHGGADRVVPVAGGPVLGGTLRAEALRTTLERWRADPARRVVARLAPRTGHAWPPLASEEIVATFAG